MNLLFLTLMYPDDLIDEAARLTRDGLQMQINGFQRALVGGLEGCLRAGESMELVNSLPVGVFPTRYKRLILKGFTHGKNMRELGCVNLPWLKQRARERGAYRAILAWAAKSPQNRTVLMYTLYLPYMKAVASTKRRYPDLKAAVIVTDLPNELGIASYRHGLLKKAEYAMGDRRVRLCERMDGFVLLTKHMAEALPINGMPQTVVEGLVASDGAPACGEPPKRFTLLYTGTMNRELGVGELLKAFEGLPDCDLWLCGLGDMRQAAEEAARKYPNIRYFGFVPQEKALELQGQATALVNPRTPQGAFTRYSFPSKTLEYLRAGKLVLCYKLDGIPDDYDPYLCYIAREGAQGIRESVLALRSLPPNELRARGAAGRAYALEHKSAAAQAARVMDMLRTL